MPLSTTCIGDSSSLNLSVTAEGTLTADVIIDPDPANLAEVTDDGVLVAGRGQVIPVGTILPYAGSTVPDGYLSCNGAAVSRSTYATLYAVVGTSFGVGDGSTTFNLPNMGGRMPTGYGRAGTTPSSEVTTIGQDDSIALALRRPKHRHTVNDPGHTHGLPSGDQGSGLSALGGGQGNFSTEVATGISVTGVTVGPAGSPVDSPAYLVLNFVIKA